VLHNYGPKILWAETLGHKTRGFSVGSKNVLKHPLNKKKSAAGKKWLRSFLKRHPILRIGDRGSTVVKVLRYKSEGRWFDSNWCQWIFH